MDCFCGGWEIKINDWGDNEMEKKGGTKKCIYKSNFFVKRLVFKEEKVLNVCNREGLSQEGRESYKDERDFFVLVRLLW